MKYEFHPWEIWNGGECPCPGELVQIQFAWNKRADVIVSEPDYAEDWCWEEGGGIIAFRRVKKPETVTLHGGKYSWGWCLNTQKGPEDTHLLIFEVVNGEPVNPRFERIKK